MLVFTTRELAKRWNVNPGTLDNWRSKGVGPTFSRLGHQVVYSAQEIERLERKKPLLRKANRPRNARLFSSQ